MAAIFSWPWLLLRLVVTIARRLFLRHNCRNNSRQAIVTTPSAIVTTRRNNSHCVFSLYLANRELANYNLGAIGRYVVITT